MKKKAKRYCKPHNAGLNSTAAAVASKLGKMLDAMSTIDAWIVEGDIVHELWELRMKLGERLEAEGWTISTVDGSLQGTDRIRVYPPGSPTGEKIRNWRKEKAD